jgi:hypothetical protein
MAFGQTVLGQMVFRSNGLRSKIFGEMIFRTSDPEPTFNMVFDVTENFMESASLIPFSESSLFNQTSNKAQHSHICIQSVYLHFTNDIVFIHDYNFFCPLLIKSCRFVDAVRCKLVCIYYKIHIDCGTTLVPHINISLQTIMQRFTYYLFRRKSTKFMHSS